MSDTDNLTRGDSQTEDATSRFPSLDSLRTVHSVLLKRYREGGDAPEFLDKVEDFIHRGQATGALLDVEDDRWAAQSLLDYWATMLYRVKHSSPDATLAEFDPMLAPKLDDDLCPYVGLDAFKEGDQNVFFGRRRLVKDMGDRLEKNRLLAVVGPSGSGKSSLVLAGLLPALKAGAVSGSQNWRYYPRMVPGSKPLENLARLLRPVGVNASEWDREQVERFRQDAGHLTQLLDDLGDGPAVLVIDQFEEAFTLCEDNDTRQAFADNLLGLVQSPGDRHIVILTMRIDFEPRLARLPKLQPLFEKAQVSVPPLNVSELRRAIEEPAALVGLKFEEGVVDTLLHDILGEPAALPLLQFTLLKLWEERDHNRVTWGAYSRLGGGRQALAHSADEFYEGLIPEEQVTARRILLRMVRPGQGLEVTSNRVRREELYQAGEAKDRIDRVLDKLVQARLVHLAEGDTPGDAQVEVAHEALVRNWPRLVDWVEDEREAMRHRLRLTAAAEQWDALDRDPEALWRGVLLEQALRHQDLNELEAGFVQASQAAAKQAEQEAEAARQRELAQARALATEKANAARRLGRLALVLAAVFLLAVWWGAAAVIQGQKAQSSANLAGIKQAEAVDAQSTAEAARDAAKTAEAEAVTSAAEAQLAATQVAHSAAEIKSLILAIGAQDALSDDDIDTALALALAANTIVERPLAQAKQILTQAACAPATRRRFEHNAPLYSAAFSPDGRTILAGSSDGSLILWDIESGEQVRRFGGHTGEVWSVAISPDGRTALSGAADNNLILWDVESGGEIRRFEGHTDAVLGVAISPDGRTALSGSKDNSLILWDVESGEEIRRFEGHTDWVWSVAFISPDGHTALSGSEDDDLILWDIESGEEIRRFEGHIDGVRTVTFSPDGAMALSGSYDDTLILWDIGNGTIVHTFFEEYAGTVYGAAIGPDGRFVLSGSEDGNLYLWDVESGNVIHRFAGHTDWVRAAALAPDGRTALSASEDGSLRLWDIESGAEIRRFGGKETLCTASHLAWKIDDAVFGVAISPDGHTALLGAGDGSLILWDIESGGETRRFEGHAAEVLGVAFSPDGDTALSSSPDDGLILWDIESGEEIRRFGEYTDQLFGGVAFGPNGDTALSSSLDGGLTLWDIENGEEIGRFGEYTAEVFGVAFSPDGGTALSGSLYDGLILWDIESGEEIRRFGEDTQVPGVAFSLDGETALSGSLDGSLILWDIESGKEICRFEGHTAEVFGAAFSPDGSTALSGSLDGSLILWDLESIKGEEKTYDPVHSVAIGPGGSVALAGSRDGSLILWDIESGEEVHRLKGHTDVVNSITLSLDGRIALSGSADNTLILWDLENKKEIRRFEGHTDAVLGVALGPDGHTALSSSADTTLISWDIESGEIISRFKGHTDWVYCVAISPDGHTALSGSADGDIILWDIESGTEIRRLEGHTGWVLSIAFSPDGRSALSGSTDGKLILWDVENGEEIRRFEAYFGLVGAVAFSPDGHTALSGFADGTLTLWDVESGTALYHFSGGHTDAVNSVAFGPDGRTALSGSDDASLILWRIHSPDELVEWTSHNRYVRELNCDEREQYFIEPFCTPTPTPTPTPDLTPMPTATPSSAGEATPGDNRGEVPLGGAQVWTYDGQTGEMLTILVSADRPANTATSQRERRERELLDTALTVYAPDGAILVEADDIERGAVTDPFIEALMLPASGVYHIEVRSQENLTGGAYTLILTSVQAQEIAFGETVTGTVEPGGRYTWAFEGAAGQTITIMMSQDNSGLDSYLVLRGPDGMTLAQDDDSGGDYNSMIDHFSLPETGIYVIVARGYSSENVGAYTLTLIDEAENSAD